MSTVAIVLIALGVVVLLFFIGGLVAARARARRQEDTFYVHVRAADEALQQARALDRGWHRETMESVARTAIDAARPSWPYENLHLVLVEDRPGIEEDRAHFVAIGPDGQSRIILARQGDDWVAEQVD
jgi:hypothetical protein